MISICFLLVLFLIFYLIPNHSVFCDSDLTEIDNLEPIDISSLGNRLYGLPDPKVGDRLESENLTIFNPEELGSYAEGDILLPKRIINGRSGILDEVYRWPNGVVPIVISGSFTKTDLSTINSAIDEYHKKTCIRFKKKNTEKDYIDIKNGHTGCWANVGRIGGAQTVNFQSPGCLYKIGTVMHEFLHILGFTHEQNREDRDNFIQINWENVQEQAKGNFEKAKQGSTTAFGINYDYESVMHYNPKAFAVNSAQNTISTTNSDNMKKMGQREGFSPSDVKKIWKMYKCKSTTVSGSTKKSYLFA